VGALTPNTKQTEKEREQHCRQIDHHDQGNRLFEAHSIGKMAVQQTS
jgi:hypothetical protein